MNITPGSPPSTRPALGPSRSSEPMFDHEKLDACRLELQFIALVNALWEDVSGRAHSRAAEACDQLDRASQSAPLNTAEGNGKRQRLGGQSFSMMPAAQRPNARHVWMRRRPQTPRLRIAFWKASDFWFESFRCFAGWPTVSTRVDNCVPPPPARRCRLGRWPIAEPHRGRGRDRFYGPHHH